MPVPDERAELRPRAPTRRPTTARSRQEAAPSARLTDAELDGIERHLASLPVHTGARVIDAPSLGVLLVRSHPPAPGLDQAAMVRWPDTGWEPHLAALEAQARVDGAWPALLVAEGLSRPAGLPDRLKALGWAEVGRETTLYTRHPATVPHLDPQLRLEAVTERSAAGYEEVERRIFGLPEGGARTRAEGLTAGIRDGTLRAFMVRSEGRAVAVARLSLVAGMAGLYGIGVTAERRREGLGGFVTAVAMRAALARAGGLVWLSVEEGNIPAIGLYGRLGFQPAFRWSRWVAPVR